MSAKNDLTARAQARAAQLAAEPLHPWMLEQIRRDAEVAHQWLAKQQGQST